MWISTEFFEQLCPSYQKVIKELDDKLFQSDDAQIPKYEIIEKFYTDYMMPKEYWQLYGRWFDNEELHREDVNDERHWKEYQQFYYDSSFRELKNFEYKKMKLLYQKIKASENNVEEWFQNLIECGDNEFVIHNVEYRLGGNLLDTKLWKLYITFLDRADIKKMLETYAKYCRFFLDDLEMKKEYKEKVEKYGPSTVCYWDTVFDFEEKGNADENDEFVDDFVEDYDSEMADVNWDDDYDGTLTPSPVDTKLLKSFYQSYCQNQNFPFQKPLMGYIFDFANATVWRKLHQTCKYFWAKKPTPICYRLQVKDGASLFIKDSLELGTIKFRCKSSQHKNTESINSKNTWISISLFCNFNQSFHHTYFSSVILPCLYKCDAKYITLWNQTLSFNELKFLIGSGNVVYLNLACVRIKDNKVEGVNLESIMELLPNVEKLLLSNVKVNKSTANALAKQQLNSKIITLELLDIFGEPFDTSEFQKFCQQNRDEHFFLRMEFKPRQPAIKYEYITNFQKFMHESNNLKKTHVEINFTPM